MPEYATQKDRLIRLEFECFVRIGMNPELRRHFTYLLENRVLCNCSHFILPPFEFEVHDDEGKLTEMWYVEPTAEQLARLLDFLRRFSLRDVQLIDSMLHR